ncbi:tRNA-uridine aminocarboxypropyltransferase [Thiomicrorhabdus sp.]|uniref:tRNA-uridine aminocarboxypropyltransferase n=1 Tax=Thiomicrorhabdus sp. TaxID=2039724 RepID=UPI0029C69B1B|nr:tRNA-uridine aminocarboxypropyltransferase [Thiomicrorhabdus sp.]
MTRSTCCHCRRPQKSCLCRWAKPVDNRVEFTILQHPTESKNAKGTARLADLMLRSSSLWVGERLEDACYDGCETSQRQAFSANLAEYLQDRKQTFLLYPHREGLTSEKVCSLQGVKEWPPDQVRILVLDATWKKSYKQLLFNPLLQQIPRIELGAFQPSRYRIRKQKNVNSLSTLEAIYECLEVLDDASASRDRLLQGFEAMQQQWLRFVADKRGN